MLRAQRDGVLLKLELQFSLREISSEKDLEILLKKQKKTYVSLGWHVKIKKNDLYSPLRVAMKKLPIGALSFESLRENDKYYVDKTPFIKTVFEDDADILLITRPRRFGKSLFMDAMNRFFAIAPNNPGCSRKNAELFSGLKILEDKEFCDAHMGQYPVVSITLKDVKDNNFIDAYKTFAEMISGKAREFLFLMDSPRLNEYEKDTLAKYSSTEFLRKVENKDYLKSYLKNIITFLGKHFERKVIVLIDEYDVPLAKAAKHGYYEEMIPIIQGFLGQALKPDSACSVYLQKSVLTGCLRVSKESIFTDFNNPDVNTVCSDDLTLAEAIGFTASETKELLRYYGLASQFDEVQRWYDGYRFAGRDIYCPWDLINFCSKSIVAAPDGCSLRNYWIGTSGNDVVDTFLGFLSGEDTEKMQTLVDGGSIEVDVNETLNYGELKEHKPRDFWTLLLFTGYLTIAERLPQSATRFMLKIPNEEIRDTFVRKVQARFSKSNKVFSRDSVELARAFLSGDTATARLKLKYLLQCYVSVRDRATRAPAENFYHGFLSGVMSSAEEVISIFRSNAEAGEGYADILFTSVKEDVGVIVEIKVCDKREGSMAVANKALEQITEKKYEQYFEDFDCKKILAYGLVFFGKECNIRSKTLKD